MPLRRCAEHSALSFTAPCEGQRRFSPLLFFFKKKRAVHVVVTQHHRQS